MRSTLDRWPPLTKRREDWRVVPNLVDYDQTRTGFSWQAARGLLDGLPGGRGLNIAYEAVDRHVSGAKGVRVAFRWIARSTIAPEARGQPIAPAANLREQLDLDSMDALNFIIGLHEEFGFEIPESDYAKLESLESIVTYLAGRLAEKARS